MLLSEKLQAVSKGAVFEPQQLRLAREISAKLPVSAKWQTLHRITMDSLSSSEMRYEEWENERYLVTARHFSTGWCGMDQAYTLLGIQNEDQSARHDWRDFQRIKNDVCGAEWEAVELYPSESRLVDPSNYFLLFAVPPNVLGFGVRKGRQVFGPTNCFAPQRGWAKGDAPAEVKK